MIIPQENSEEVKKRDCVPPDVIGQGRRQHINISHGNQDKRQNHIN